MITKNYIKMCEKAKEIQRKWIPLIGDWAVIPPRVIPVIIRFSKTINNMDRNNYTWIPTLEQLFNMLEEKLQPFYFDFSWNGDYVIETSAQESTFFWNHGTRKYIFLESLL